MQVKRAEQTASQSNHSPDKTCTSGSYDRNAAHVLLAQECRARVEDLTPRQRDVLAALVAGRRNKQIAQILGLSPRTVEIHRAGMMNRLNVRSLAHAIQIAIAAGLVPLEIPST